MEKRYFNITETAEYTGIPVKTLYKWCQARRIPFTQPGGKIIRFDIKEIEVWINKSKVIPLK